MPKKMIRIGGASGFWGDSRLGAVQLVQAEPAIDYLVFDYLAETTMAILAAARLKKPELGYATDFVDSAMKSVLADVMAKGIKVIANAGGIHPEGCAQALRAMAQGMGLNPRIAVVTGDDVSVLLPDLRAQGVTDMFSGAPLPEKILSANAYLGAWPIVEALRQGADIVITGRCVDSAVTLAPLIHEFGWQPTDWDRLAGGSLGGHIIECGCQATGGLFTDWQSVPNWPQMGYPIIECEPDGSFVVTKAAGTGGLISPASVGEQLLYEIGDPGAYVLPDVVCDFRHVRMTQEGEQRVRVSGAQGSAPPDTYKVSATAIAGYRCVGSLVLIGPQAAAKAQRTGDAIVARTRQMLKDLGWPDFTQAEVHLFGAETLYGEHARTGDSREVMVRISVSHKQREALELFAREIAPAGTSWAPGTTGASGGRPSPSPRILPLAFLLDKARVAVHISLGDQQHAVTLPLHHGQVTSPAPLSWPQWRENAEPQQSIPLEALAWARSGDKGNISNIGVIARRPEWLPLIADRVSTEGVKAYFSSLVQGTVERFYLPGLHAFNYVLHDALDGGGPASNRVDPLGKGMGQMLLDLQVRVPQSVAREALSARAARPIAADDAPVG